MIRKHIILILTVAIMIVLLLWWFLRDKPADNADLDNQIDQTNEADQTENPTSTESGQTEDEAQPEEEQVNDSDSFIWPLDRAEERITKKSFGTYVTPQNSPVSPERFSGYHTGVDFETFAEEQNIDVAIKIICKGDLRTVATASGYGGYVIQECKYQNQPIIVVYGHVASASVVHKIGSTLEAGQILGRLGNPGPETDEERKHLHLSIHRGPSTNIRGYVSSESSLNEWLNPIEVLREASR